MEPNTRRRRRSGIQNAISGRQGPQRLNVVAPINVQRNPNTGAAAGIAQALGLFAPIGETLISQSIDKKRDAATAAGLSGAEENPEGSAFDQAFLRARGIRDAQVSIAGLEQEIEDFITEQEALAADNGDVGGATVEDVNAFIEAKFQGLLLNDAGEVDVERFGSEKAVKEIAGQLASTRATLLKAATEDIRTLQLSRFVRIQSDRLEANLVTAGVFDIEAIFQEAPREFRGAEMKNAFAAEMVNIAVRQGNPEALISAVEARFKDGVKIFDVNQRRVLENGVVSAQSIKAQQAKAEAASLSNDAQIGIINGIEVDRVDQTPQILAAMEARVITASTAKSMLTFQEARKNAIEGEAPDFNVIAAFRLTIDSSTDEPQRLRNALFQAYSSGQFGDPTTKTAADALSSLLDDVNQRERAATQSPRVQGTLRFQAAIDSVKGQFTPNESRAFGKNRGQVTIQAQAVRRLRLLIDGGKDPIEAEAQVFEEFQEKFNAAARGNSNPPAVESLIEKSEARQLEEDKELDALRKELEKEDQS